MILGMRSSLPGFSPVVSQNFLTNTTSPSWLDVSATTGNRMLYDSTGKLTWAPNNLLTYSNTFSNASWVNTTMTVASGVSDPIGGSNAWTATAAGANSRLYKLASGTSGQQIASIWIRRRTGSGGVFLQNAAGGLTDITASVTSSWSQIYVKSAAGAGYNGIYLSVSGDAVDIYNCVTANVTYETTPRASDQIITTTAAYYGPRFDYDPSTLAAKGLLIEESRANLLTYSEQFDNAAWSIGGILAWGSGSIANNAVSPDGTTTADKAVEDTSTGLHRTFRSFSATSGSSYAFTVYAKAAGRSVINMAYGGAGMVAGSASFDLSAGTVSNVTSATASITSIGNGWYRCSLVAAAAATNTGLVYVNLTNGTSTSYTGDGTSGVLLWGAQLEAGSFATSYIPTTTASVTRAADIIKLSGAALTTLQGTAFSASVQATLLSTATSAVLIGSGTGATQAIMFANAASSVRNFDQSSSPVNSTPASAGSGSWLTVARACFAADASSRTLVLSNGTVVTTSGPLVTARTNARIGAFVDGTLPMSGWVNSLAIYNQRLPNATLQTKSTVGSPL